MNPEVQYRVHEGSLIIPIQFLILTPISLGSVLISSSNVEHFLAYEPGGPIPRHKRSLIRPVQILKETEVTSTPTRHVENVTTTKGLQDRNNQLLDGGTLENKGKLILTDTQLFRICRLMWTRIHVDSLKQSTINFMASETRRFNAAFTRTWSYGFIFHGVSTINIILR